MVQGAGANADQDLVGFDLRLRDVLVRRALRARHADECGRLSSSGTIMKKQVAFSNRHSAHASRSRKWRAAIAIISLKCRKLAFSPLPLPLWLLQAQTAAKFALTSTTSCAAPASSDTSPRRCAGRATAARVYFQWKPRRRRKERARWTPTSPDRDGTGLRKLSDEEARLAPPAAGDLVQRQAPHRLYAAPATCSSTTTPPARPARSPGPPTPRCNPRFLAGRQAHLPSPAPTTSTSSRSRTGRSRR